MRLVDGFVTATVALACAAGAAMAAPTLQVRGAAARIVVIPENRDNVVVTVLSRSRRLPLKVRTFGRSAFVTGDVGHRSHGCQAVGRTGGVGIWGRGTIPFADLPRLVVRTPMDVHISAGEAVFGDVGRSRGLDLVNQGCGGWTIANVAGRLRLDQAGSGHARAGSAGSADLNVAGSGEIDTRAIAGRVTAVSSSSGDIAIASLNGPLDVRIAGSGDVSVGAGRASMMTASIAGSGNVRFGGVAGALNASITGAGDVVVARAAGPVVRRVFGSGAVRVGP